MDYFDLRPQKFYLLSAKARKLLSFASDDKLLENAVEEAFAKLPKVEGGNVYAIFRYEPMMLKVMMELSDRFKDKYSCIQSLPSFMRQLEEGDVFIRHQAWTTLPDLKRSMIKLKAIIEGRDMYRDDTTFMLNWTRLYLKYDTFSYGFLTDRIYVGEEDRDKRECRFCHNKGDERFRHESHAMMEALGNKLLFCNEECDECNQILEGSVEKQLFKFLEIQRTLSNVPGKKRKHHYLEGENFHIRPDLTTNKPVVYVKQETIINDMYKGRATGQILLFNKGDISYYGIYKALVKIAIDMMPTEHYAHFKDAGSWVCGAKKGGNLPTFLYGEHAGFFEQPEIDLFFRKSESPHFSPYCIAVIYIYCSIFIFTVPFCDLDDDSSNSTTSLKACYDFFKKYQYLYIAEWVEYDANDKTPRKPFYKSYILPQGAPYKIVFKPSTDEVFKRER